LMDSATGSSVLDALQRLDVRLVQRGRRGLAVVAGTPSGQSASRSRVASVGQ